MDFNLLTTLFIAFGITYLVIPEVLHIAQKKELFDQPNHRKTHTRPIPALGGIGIFLGFWSAVFYFIDLQFLMEIKFLFIGSSLLLLVGVQDDLLGMKSLIKLFWQVLVASMVFFSDIQIKGLYGFLGIEEVPYILSFLLTILVVVFIINAFNLIDGVNGLAGSLGLLASLGFSFLFWKSGETNWFVISILLSASLIAFLRYNFGKASIFMGDNGSMFVGLIVAILFTSYINLSPITAAVPSLILALSLILIPVFDALRVFCFRLLKGQSPFTADRNHLHHLLQDMGKSHRWVVLMLLSINLMVIIAVVGYFPEVTISSFLVCTGMLLLFFVELVCFSKNLTDIKDTELERHHIGFLE